MSEMFPLKIGDGAGHPQAKGPPRDPVDREPRVAGLGGASVLLTTQLTARSRKA